MKKILSYSVVLFVLIIILLLIIPLPAGLVDVAIILNMSLSMMILVTTMTIREPLEFSIFPSLLLVTTLFRLGINVSTTRNILTNMGVIGPGHQGLRGLCAQGKCGGGFHHLPHHCTDAVHCNHKGRRACG